MEPPEALQCAGAAHWLFLLRELQTTERQWPLIVLFIGQMVTTQTFK